MALSFAGADASIDRKPLCGCIKVSNAPLSGKSKLVNCKLPACTLSSQVKEDRPEDGIPCLRENKNRK